MMRSPALLLESLSTAVLVLDAQLRVQYANQAAEQLLATSRQHLRQQEWDVFFDAAHWSTDSLRQALRSQQPFTQREARLRGPGGVFLATVDYTATPVPAAVGSGAEACLLIELHPLDRRIHAHREDGLLTANQATRALVRGLAHEIKNPLGGIRGAAQLLERQPGGAALREYTEVIIHEADRLRILVDRMLGARRPPAFGRVNIHQILERVRRIVQAETAGALELARDYDPSLPEVQADADQLIQVFLNIVRNAAQALLEMPQGDGATGQARPCILIRSRIVHQFTIGARRYPLLCRIEVQDNGPGIHRDLWETLFYPMVTGRAQGTGLGLPIAQAIMRQHGGLIEFSSRPGQTVFKILLPLHPVADADKGVLTHARP